MESFLEMGASSLASIPLNLLRSIAGCANADPVVNTKPINKPNQNFLVINFKSFVANGLCLCTGLQICMKFGGYVIFFNFIDGKCISLQHGMVCGSRNRFGFYR